MVVLNLITKEDLEQFKIELFEELKLIRTDAGIEKSFLRSSEVRKLLKISPGTLQNLRVNGTLPYEKIGGILYYAHSDIKKLLSNIGKS